MRKNRIFQWCYLSLAVLFLLSGAALAVRLVQMRSGNAFYGTLCEEQINAEDGAGPDADGSSAVTYFLPDGKEEKGRKRTPGKIPGKTPELSERVARLEENYPDITAWLCIPDTSVDYPVMYNGDQLFYLDHLPDGSRNALGSLFVDCRCGGESMHVIIYGHNGSGGKMFGGLKQYESQDYLETHATVTLATRNGVYVCPVFSVRRVEAGGSAYRVDFEDAESLGEYISQAAAQSLFPVEADTGGAAGVLTLSTCTGWYGKRLIVQALLPSSFSGLPLS